MKIKISFRAGQAIGEYRQHLRDESERPEPRPPATDEEVLKSIRAALPPATPEEMERINALPPAPIKKGDCKAIINRDGKLVFRIHGKGGADMQRTALGEQVAAYGAEFQTRMVKVERTTRLMVENRKGTGTKANQARAFATEKAVLAIIAELEFNGKRATAGAIRLQLQKRHNIALTEGRIRQIRAKKTIMPEKG